MNEKPILGVIGGSGLYRFSALEHVETIEVETPFGSPSSPIVLGTLEGKRIAFLARHGLGHFILPSEVNYRANIYALKQLGVEYVIGVSACGSLRDDYRPGHFVVPDQLFDFTRARQRSFFGEGLVAHIGVADPFCPNLSGLLYRAATSSGATVHRGGTFITIEGPRFSTRAESNLYRAWGMSIIGMTTCPRHSWRVKPSCAMRFWPMSPIMTSGTPAKSRSAWRWSFARSARTCKPLRKLFATWWVYWMACARANARRLFPKP